MNTPITLNTIQEKWDDVMTMMRRDNNIADAAYKTFIRLLSPFSLQTEVNGDDILHKLTIIIDDSNIGPYCKSFIEARYALFIQLALTNFFNAIFEIDYILMSSSNAKAPVMKAAVPHSQTSGKISNLNPKYTFDTFVVGKNNNLAHAAALAVAESPAQIYNPLFIWGGVGLGKTHLMHAIGNHIQKADSNAKILYVTSEKFTNELIDSIRSNKTTEFRDKYRKIDVLLIDDIQFIMGKESTQEEFFHTFNELHEAKKQIIISSDRPPKDMQTLEDRLRSRFEWGMIADIQSPDYETRMAILNRKNEVERLNISEDILKFIATNIRSNIRELEGALTKLVALSTLKKTDISLALAEEAIRDYISAETPKAVTIQSIIDIVAEHYNITSAEIRSNNRSRNIALPRQITMYLCRKLTDMSLTDVGEALGKKDHTTVMHGVNVITKALQTDTALQNTIEILTKKINPN